MKVELLYFEGCPSYEALLPELRALLADAGVAEPLQLRRVETIDEAERERFLGSPTVRVDGKDVDPGAAGREDFGLKCRLYRDGEGLVHRPPARWIRAALDRPVAPAATEGALAACRLDAAGLDSQRARYRRLGAAAEAVERSRGSLLVRFGPDLDRALLEETIAVETECCPFFEFDYAPAERRLRIGVADDERDAALDALAFALGAPSPQGQWQVER